MSGVTLAFSAAAATSGAAACSSQCTILVYNDGMPRTRRAAPKAVRRSISLPRDLGAEVDAIAKRRQLSDNRVLVELVEQGLEAQKQKEKAFFELAERFRAANTE